MRASRSAQEFFATDQRGFRIDPAQRLTIAARLAQGLAGRQPAGPS
jgi:hypothetical protein